MPVAFSKEFYTIFQVNKTKYSKIDQVKFVQDSL